MIYMTKLLRSNKKIWKMTENLEWLLDRIDTLEELHAKNPHRLPTHKAIWSGSYDVWMCEQDKIDSVEIPKARMKEAEDAGLIKSEEKQVGSFSVILWSLTEDGKASLNHARKVRNDR